MDENIIPNSIRYKNSNNLITFYKNERITLTNYFLIGYNMQ